MHKCMGMPIPYTFYTGPMTDTSMLCTLYLIPCMPCIGYFTPISAMVCYGMKWYLLLHATPPYSHTCTHIHDTCHAQTHAHAMHRHVHKHMHRYMHRHMPCTDTHITDTCHAQTHAHTVMNQQTNKPNERPSNQQQNNYCFSNLSDLFNHVC